MNTETQKPAQQDTRSLATSENWTQKNARGREEAEGLIALMRQNEAPMLLGHRVKRMVEDGSYGGFKLGFLHQISAALLR